MKNWRISSGRCRLDRLIRLGGHCDWIRWTRDHCTPCVWRPGGYRDPVAVAWERPDEARLAKGRHLQPRIGRADFDLSGWRGRFGEEPRACTDGQELTVGKRK